MKNFKNIQQGDIVCITQQIPHQEDGGWNSRVCGIIKRVRQAKTGSWFAHAQDDKLWLDRIELELEDGELVILNLDQYSVIERMNKS